MQNLLQDPNIIAILDTLTKEELEEFLLFLSDYEDTPVSIDEFIDNPEYLGGYFENGFNPYWRGIMREIYPSPLYSPYFLVNLRGSIGRGKTTAACTGIAYDLHKLQCMLNPQKSLGLISSTKIVFALFNVTMGLANDVVWDQLSQMFTASPYFNKLMNVARRGVKRDTLFPKRVDFFIGSRVGHSLGKAVHSAILSEANFEVVGDQVYTAFNSLLARMQSRFLQPGGALPGKVWVDSSEGDKLGAINKVIDSYKNNPGVYVDRGPIWQVWPNRYGTERFRIYKGSEIKPPQIIDENNLYDLELAREEPGGIVEVPVEHRERFDIDLRASMRDLAGIPTSGNYKLFSLRERINNAARIINIFHKEIISLNFDDDTDLIQNHVRYPQYFTNALDKQMPRYIHIDIGLTGDRLGMAASYVSHFRETTIRDPHNFNTITDSVPVINTEWAIGVEARPGQQIPLFKIRQFIMWLADCGYSIAMITCDGFQSADMLQGMMKLGYNTDLLSVDRTSIPYLNYRNNMYQGFANIPQHSILLRELIELEITPDGKKVDHPDMSDSNNTMKGSKDIADAACGSYEKCRENADQYRMYMWKDPTLLPNSANGEVAEMFWG